MAGSDSCKQAPAGEVDGINGLQGKVVVAEEAVHTQQADQAEVAKHTVDGALVAVVRLGIVRVLALKEVDNVGPGHKAVQVVEHRCGAPQVYLGSNALQVLLSLGVVALVVTQYLVKLATELAKRLELIDEFVDDVPKPLVGEVKVHTLGVENEVEQDTVVLVGLNSLFDCWLKAGIDVSVVKLLVEAKEQLIGANKLRN
mmetsp:Transcript_27991/g.70254  ORF Transcript_27991/g.70254 Transcript_27991/m.70254 type:complete len:200 (+) Transcript_27991:1010-1609(+)